MNAKVTMYIRKDAGQPMDQLSKVTRLNSLNRLYFIFQTAESRTPITRLNTRVIVSTVKYNKVACFNMGLHLF